MPTQALRPGHPRLCGRQPWRPISFHCTLKWHLQGAVPTCADNPQRRVRMPQVARDSAWPAQGLRPLDRRPSPPVPLPPKGCTSWMSSGNAPAAHRHCHGHHPCPRPRPVPTPAPAPAPAPGCSSCRDGRLSLSSPWGEGLTPGSGPAGGCADRSYADLHMRAASAEQSLCRQRHARGHSLAAPSGAACAVSRSPWPQSPVAHAGEASASPSALAPWRPGRRSPWETSPHGPDRPSSEAGVKRAGLPRLMRSDAV